MTSAGQPDSRRTRLAALLHSQASRRDKLQQTIWILGAMVTPAPLKRLLVPWLRGSRAAFTAPPILSAAPPYVARPRSRPRADRVRVVHAIGNFMTGGSSQLVVDLVEHLSDEYEQQVVTGFLPSPPAYVGLPVRMIVSQEGLLSYLRSYQPHAIHVHYWHDEWYRTVFKVSERYGCTVIENVNTPVKPVIQRWIRSYVFVSDYVRREFAPALSRSEVIHPGAHLDRFTRSAGDVADDCLGMVYRLERDKLNEQSVDVFLEVLRRRPGTRALIVGDGPLRAEFQDAVTRAGFDSEVEFTGYVSFRDLPPLYERMALFVAPVWRESFGQVAPLAMGMGLPVIGFDVGALPEIVDDRDLLAPPGDVGALADLAIRLLDDHDRRVEIGRRNAIRAREQFGVETMVARYRTLYRSVIGVPA